MAATKKRIRIIAEFFADQRGGGERIYPTTLTIDSPFRNLVNVIERLDAALLTLH